MKDVRPDMKATRDLLEIARADAARAQERLKREEGRAAQRSEYARDYNEGRGLSIRQIAEKWEVSQETVRTALKREGVYTPQRRGKVTPEMRERIITALKDNPNVGEQAVAWHLSAATIRKIGIESGVLEKGPPRAKRSEKQMGDIKVVDEALRKEFGAGLLALGAALRTWEKSADPEVFTPEDRAEAIDIAEKAEAAAGETPPW